MLKGAGHGSIARAIRAVFEGDTVPSGSVGEAVCKRSLTSQNTPWPERQLFYGSYLLVLLGLAPLAPRLEQLVGSAGRRFPGWLLHTFLAVIVLQACTVFSQAVISPWLATFAPEALDREDGGSFAIAMGVIWVLWSLTLIVLAVVGAHRRIVPLAAAVLVALGGARHPGVRPCGRHRNRVWAHAVGSSRGGSTDGRNSSPDARSRGVALVLPSCHD